MSYILDALRRADAERERGQVPGLHTRGASVPAPGVASSPWKAGAVGIGAGAALAIAALIAWRWWPAAGTDTALPIAVTAPAVLPAAPVALAPVPTPAPTPVPAPATAATRVVEAPLVAPATNVAVTPPRKRIASAEAPSPPLARPPVAVGAASAVAPPPPVTLAELPDDIRRQLPAFAVGGSAYSTSANSRFIIVNGQLFHEGDALSPGLVLDQIRQKSAVLAFKGYRYIIGL